MRLATRLAIGLGVAAAMTTAARAQTPAETETETPAAPTGPRTVRQASPYADVRARGVGDIVTVAIVERSTASNTSELNTQRKTSFENGSSGGTGALDFIPDFGFSGDLGRTHEGRGTSTQEGRLSARMAVTVVAVQPNGDLDIAGEREVAVNDEKETLRLTGRIRPTDIGTGNVVLSSDIAGAQITYKGKGKVSKGSHPNIIARVLSWIF